MSRFIGSVCLIATLIVPAERAQAQFTEPSPEHKVVQRDVGRWNASVKMWMGADGQADPSAEPQVSKGSEVNRKLGEFWVLSTFKGEFAGMPFEGHSVNGFDPKTKKFVGSWTDSFTPHAMHMSGTYDEATETLTFVTKGIGMDGNEVEGKSEMKYEGKRRRVLTMYEMKDGKPIKMMEITYERAPASQPAAK
ncbi:MAG: DUF1579 domain-containing protein [Planctomycetales bacterium]|nr:DUF1579 domain-containing protein [Planctomycetales bacterium]